MFRKEALFALLAAASFAPRHIFAQDLHLKARGAAASSRLQPRTAMPAQDTAAQHWIVEFDHAPGAADLAAIAAAGADVTGALPDNAVIMSGPTAGFAAHIAGVRWAGPMETPDKLSPELDWALPSLDVVVEFHADVSQAAQDLAAASEGLALFPLSVLAPGHALISAPGDRLLALAAHDEVDYIFPADPALNTDSDLQACAGMLTLTGKVGQYANIVHGWDLGADNFLHLGYNFGALTPKVPAATVQSEIIRALNECRNIPT